MNKIKTTFVYYLEFQSLTLRVLDEGYSSEWLSALWCPLQYPRKNDVQFVFVCRCL